MNIIRGEADTEGHPKIMLDAESGWKPRLQDYRQIQKANNATPVTVDSSFWRRPKDLEKSAKTNARH